MEKQELPVMLSLKSCSGTHCELARQFFIVWIIERAFRSGPKDLANTSRV